MKKLSILVSVLFLAVFTVASQELLWKAGVHSFFDNTEFTGSKVQIPQTMAGVHLTPEIGVDWEKNHRIYAGVDLLHEWGGDKIFARYDPVIYYEYAGHPFHFYMGAIPREKLLKRYPRMFFQDSIRNYRPVINGFFWEYARKKNYINIWLDWTGRQSEKTNEAFFMGWSGRYTYQWFYFQHFGYMYHYAKKKEPVLQEPIHDNGLILTSFGLDFSSLLPLETLEINGGWSIGLDRDRGVGEWATPQGFFSELKAEYRGLGLLNTLYLGDGQQIYYSDHGSNLYWGDPFYRLKRYNRTDLSIHFFQSRVVQLKFVCSFHLAERKMYNQQALYATFDLDNLPKKKEKNYHYIWDRWF